MYYCWLFWSVCICGFCVITRYTNICYTYNRRDHKWVLYVINTVWLILNYFASSCPSLKLNHLVLCVPAHFVFKCGVYLLTRYWYVGGPAGAVRICGTSRTVVVVPGVTLTALWLLKLAWEMKLVKLSYTILLHYEWLHEWLSFPGSFLSRDTHSVLWKHLTALCLVQYDVGNAMFAEVCWEITRQCRKFFLIFSGIMISYGSFEWTLDEL